MTTYHMLALGGLAVAHLIAFLGVLFRQRNAFERKDHELSERIVVLEVHVKDAEAERERHATRQNEISGKFRILENKVITREHLRDTIDPLIRLMEDQAKKVDGMSSNITKLMTREQVRLESNHNHDSD